METTIAIKDYESCSAVGGSAKQLWGRIDLAHTQPRRDKRYILPDNQCAYSSAISDIDDNYRMRTWQLFVQPLQDLLARQDSLPEKCLCIVALPAADSLQANYSLSADDLRARIAEQNTLTTLSFEFFDQSNSAFHSLKRLREALQNEYQAVIWGGVDSFMNGSIIRQLHQQQALQSEEISELPAAGEGSAWLYCQPTKPGDQLPQIANGVICQQADNNRDYQVLLEQLCQQQRCTPQQLNHWVFTDKQTTAQKQDWSRLCKTYWSQTAASAQSTYIANYLGRMGASALPLGIVYALGSLSYQLQPAKRMVIVNNQSKVSGLVISI